MSERGSFTTQYIYNTEDYQIIRKALDKNIKYLCVSPPPYWESPENTCPIVSGKVGGIRLGEEWEQIHLALEGVKTESVIEVITICDCGLIVLTQKDPDGICTDFILRDDVL